MTREEAIQILADLIDSPFLHTWEKQNKALHMAIEALQFVEHFDLLKEFQSLQEVVCCNDCKYQGECEQIVVFDIHVDKVQGHRVDFCSYGERREDGEI